MTFILDIISTNSDTAIKLSEIVITSILGFSVLGATIIYNRTQNNIAKHRLQKELFSEFNKRYDKLNDDLEAITQFESMEMLMDQKPDEYKLLRYKLNDYFNLCAEEYYWYKNERIDLDLWKSWEAGMNSWYNNHRIIREAWQEEYNRFGQEAFYLKEGEQFFLGYNTKK
ncbi:hypothetical protein [Winogradskyella algicola]|uniref:hypothetical protein n=1 Tax=Winogradskyella algicola TaxID=2575815 RepID=UPI0011093727|nr:hypothetical protein [Winogradskyella algicola]